MHYVSKRKEERMKRLLLTLKSKIGPRTDKQETLNNTTEQLIMTADYREKKSRIVQKLQEKGVTVLLKSLPVADYIVSSRTGIELKSVQDFVDSLIDGRMFEQVHTLKKSFERPLIIIEGTGDIYSTRNIHPNAIRGLLITITVTYGIPILFTKTTEETTELFLSILKKETEYSSMTYTSHKAKPETIREQQEYIVNSLPGIGIQTTRKILEKYKTIQKVMNATKEELETIEGIGTTTAQKIKEVIEKEYVKE